MGQSIGAQSLTRRGFLGAVAASLATPAIAKARAKRVLFVGNSFTRHHAIPRLVDRIGSDNGHKLLIAALVHDGLPLIQHVADADVFQLARDIEPDVIVLQEHSQEPLSVDGRKRSAEALDFLTPLAPRTVLFPVWPRVSGHAFYHEAGNPQGPAEMAASIRAHHIAQQQRLGIEVADVTEVWQRAVARGLRLHADDGYHASPAGAWLAATVLARTIGVDQRMIRWHPPGVHMATARYLAGLAGAT